MFEPLQACRRAGTPALLGVVVWGLGACGTYEPARPGVHVGPLESRADVQCVYEAPTASRFVRVRCDDVRDLAERSRNDQQAADNIRPGPPPER